jgi:cytochrome c oxidase subunit 2
VSDRRSLLIALAAAVLAVAIGIVLSYVIRWFPVQASVQARNTDDFYHVLVIASIPIFVLVTTVILYSVWRFRMKPGEELKDGPPIHGNTRLEVFWTALPTVLLLGLLSYSFVVLHENEKKPANEIQIGVMGQQFAWTYEYPPSLTHGKAATSYDLYIPQGRSVEFNIRTKDVIHAFWVPAFRLQEDAVPGITTHWRVTANRLGTYPVVCNLLCGLGHALMRSRVHVVSQSRFEAFVAGLSAASSAAGSAGASGTGSSG